jgi:hypothetical protein
MTRLPTLMLLAVLLSLAVPARHCEAAQVPGAASAQRLVVSTNHRFLQRADGSPFFWMGDTAWLLFSRLTRTETLRYLDNRQAKGFNVVQVMVLHTPQMQLAGGARALVDGDPARPRVTPGENPEDPEAYDYWDHVDWVLAEAAKRNISVALVPAWGSLARSGVLNERNAADYGRFLARRFRSRPNIVWLVGGDVRGNEQFGTWNILGRTLRTEDPNHLISFHPFGRTQSSTWFQGEAWLDFNMFQSGHQRYDQDVDSPKRFGEDNWRYVLDDYAKAPQKPVLDGEPSYESIPQGLHDGTQPYWTDADARRYAYWSVFAGACGHTYGDNAVMQFHGPSAEKPSYFPKRFWYEAIDDPGAGQMHHLADLVLSRPYFDRMHDAEMIVSGGGSRYDRVLAARGRDYVFVYSYSGKPFEVRLGRVSGDRLLAWWFDPRSGEARPAGSMKNAGTHRFAPPGRPSPGRDWVLVLDDESKGYGKPGQPMPQRTERP